jgi:hypothetical protein
MKGDSIMRKAIIAAGLAAALARTSIVSSAAAADHPDYWHGKSSWSKGPHHWPRHYQPHYAYPAYPAPYYGYQRPYYGSYGYGYGYGYGYNYDPGPAIVAGAIFGMIGTALATRHHHYRRH